jgi:hypothetical protein
LRGRFIAARTRALRYGKVYTLDYDTMAPRRRYSFWIDDQQAEGLKVVKERDGVLESEQIRRAINRWLEEKGVMKAERKRTVLRKRP